MTSNISSKIIYLYILFLKKQYLAIYQNYLFIFLIIIFIIMSDYLFNYKPHSRAGNSKIEGIVKRNSMTSTQSPKILIYLPNLSKIKYPSKNQKRQFLVKQTKILQTINRTQYIINDFKKLQMKKQKQESKSNKKNPIKSTQTLLGSSEFIKFQEIDFQKNIRKNQKRRKQISQEKIDCTIVPAQKLMKGNILSKSQKNTIYKNYNKTLNNSEIKLFADKIQIKQHKPNFRRNIELIIQNDIIKKQKLIEKQAKKRMKTTTLVLNNEFSKKSDILGPWLEQDSKNLKKLIFEQS